MTGREVDLAQGLTVGRHAPPPREPSCGQEKGAGERRTTGGSWVVAVLLDCIPSLDREDGEQDRESQLTWGMWGLGTPATTK